MARFYNIDVATCNFHLPSPTLYLHGTLINTSAQIPIRYINHQCWIHACYSEIVQHGDILNTQSTPIELRICPVNGWYYVLMHRSWVANELSLSNTSMSNISEFVKPQYDFGWQSLNW